MSFFAHKPKPPAQTPPTKVAGIHVTESVNGKALPIVMGQRRVSQSLIWTGDFTALPHVHQTSTGGGGGKGLGGGGGSTTTNTTYTYTSATIGALCSGPVSGIVNVYDTKGRFTQTNIAENFTVPNGGGSYTVGKSALFKNDRGVGFATNYSQTVDDYGSPGSVTLSGSYQVPVVNNPATRIQSTGGTSTFKYFYDAGVSTNGVTYVISVSVYNQGTQPITINGNIASSPTIAAGTQQNISFTEVGDGVNHIQLLFTTNLASDTMDVLAVNPSISKLSDGINLIPSANLNFTGWSTFSGSSVTLTQNVPLAPGQYTTNNGVYTFHASDAGKVATINYSYNLLNINNEELVTIPGSPFQVTVQDSADFLSDSGVVFYSNNAALTKVASSPAAGQYSVSAGVYTFNTADSTKQVQISYVTNTQNQNSDAQTALNLTLFNGARGQGTWSYLSSRHPEASIGYSETAYVASSAMDLGSNGEMPNYSFEVAGPYQFGSGIVDCDPADCINALLTDSFFGIGFPSSYIGDWTAASNFWVANNFFISPVIESQTAVASVLGQIVEAGMTAAFFSEGLLKLVPYGDTSAAGNGQIFVPNTQPIVDLTDDDFIGDGIVKVTRSAWQDANNKVQVTWSNRSNNYNSEVTTEQDDAAITRYGQRTENPQSWDFITTLAAAQFAANLRVKRSVNIRAQYTFSIGSGFSYLEPMDLVTITVPELGWTKLPVRIQKIVDHPDENGLEITAEEFPWGTAQPTLYSKQTGVGFQPNAGQADPGNTTALIFEAPNRLGLQAGNILCGFVSGNSPDWGGCQPYVSYDGVTYQAFGPQITNPARLGTLTAYAPNNFVTNGDGETGTVGAQATGWTLGNGNGLLIATDQFFAGAHSLKIDNTVGADSYSYQDISVTDGHTYTLSGYLKTTAMPVADAGTGALLNVDIVSGVTAFMIKSKTGSDLTPSQPDVGIAADGAAHDWTYVQSVFTVSGTGTIRLYAQLGFNGAQSGVAWFDNIILTDDPDTGSITVQMANNNSVLASMSQSDFDSFVSICALTGQGIKYNIIPDSDGTQYTWSVNASLPFTPTGGAVAGGKWTCTGTGSASGFVFLHSQTFTVVPGQSYTLSGYIDGSHVTAGSPFWGIYDPTVTTQYIAVTQTAGTNGRVSVTFTVPGGVTSVVIIPDTNNCTVTNGTTLVFSDPQLEVGSTASVYQSSSDTVFELLAYRDATITGANTFQLAQLHRGLYSTTAATHITGETFARLDQASFEFQYDPNFYGKTIYFKFPSFNTVGGRPQTLAQAAVFSFTLLGAGAGAIDLNTGIYRPGQGQTQNISFPAFSITRNTTSLGLSWSGTLTRGTVPNANQASTTIDQKTLSGSVTVTGLTSGTNYWFYPYIDDLTGNPSVQFVTNSIVSGATGSPVTAYTSQNATAAAFQQRNDHVSLGVISTSTTSSGTSSGSSGGSPTGTCPRHDMVVLHREKGVVTVGSLEPGDWIWGKENGVDQWVLVRGTSRKMRRDWVEMSFDCDEAVVVTPNHSWPTDKGVTMSFLITPDHVFYQTEGRTFLNGWRKFRDEAGCITIELATEDHTYYIGRRVPKVLTQNAYVLPS